MDPTNKAFCVYVHLNIFCASALTKQVQQINWHKYHNTPVYSSPLPLTEASTLVTNHSFRGPNHSVPKEIFIDITAAM